MVRLVCVTFFLVQAFYIKQFLSHYSTKLTIIGVVARGKKRGTPRGQVWRTNRVTFFVFYLASFLRFPDSLDQNAESSSRGKIVHDMKERKQVW